eukprot:7657642-Prorocentrum_lima.AAC.1
MASFNTTHVKRHAGQPMRASGSKTCCSCSSSNSNNPSALHQPPNTIDTNGTLPHDFSLLLGGARPCSP